MTTYTLARDLTADQANLGLPAGSLVITSGSDILTMENGIAEPEGGQNKIIAAAGALLQVAYWNAPSGIVANLETGIVTGGYGGTDTLIGLIGQLAGSPHNDTITGSTNGVQTFFGSAGNDIFNGNGSDIVNYYNESSSQAVASYDAATSTWMVVKKFSNGVSGTDTLHNIDRIVFQDKSIYTPPASISPTVRILNKPQQAYSVGQYSILNNDWGAGSLIIGKDYTQTITFNNNTLQSGGVVLAWSYPERISDKFVWGYPEVYWGLQAGRNGTPIYETPISKIIDLSVNYDVAISGETSAFDVLVEIWVSNSPPGAGGFAITAEIGVFVHFPPHHAIGTAYTDSTLQATEVVSYNWPSVDHHTFVQFYTATDRLSGKIDFGNILSTLVKQGVIDPSNYVGGVELGAEPFQGSGSMTVNNFMVTEKLNTSGLIDGLTVSQQLELIYLSYFNRAADPGGYSFWSGQNVQAQNSGQSAAMALTNIANSFRPQAETIALYPFLDGSSLNLSTPGSQAGLTALIANVYQNLFNHAPDASGASYWLGQVTGGTVGLGAAILAIANGATGADAMTVLNKISLALGTTGVSASASLLPTPPEDQIKISGTNNVVDPGVGSHTIQFIAGATTDTVVLHSGGTDQIIGFDMSAGDALDVRNLFAETQLNVREVSLNLDSYLTITSQGADAALLFDPLGHGGGSAVAVFKDLGSVLTGLDVLTSHNALQI